MLPLFEVLEHEPSPSVVLATQAVDEVLIHAHEYEPTRGEQLTEISVARIGEVLRVVVAVDHEHERKGSVTLRIPDTSVERNLLHVEAPPLLPVVYLLRTDRCVGRDIHGSRFDCHRVA